MPKETIILWIIYAVMYLMSPIAAIIVQRRIDRRKKK